MTVADCSAVGINGKGASMIIVVHCSLIIVQVDHLGMINDSMLEWAQKERPIAIIQIFSLYPSLSPPIQKWVNK